MKLGPLKLKMLASSAYQIGYEMESPLPRHNG